MKRIALLFLEGIAFGVAAFLLRRGSVSAYAAACDALTLSGGAILVVGIFARLAGVGAMDGIRYVAACGLKGLFPFARTQSFRVFKEERAQKVQKRGGSDRLFFGGTLFSVGLFFAFF
ncbi:MAG: hypothetical protein IJX81_06000 [Clostridia bacterium]|nr:hypothetical protein [Clostridia bacterium]